MTSIRHVSLVSLVCLSTLLIAAEVPKEVTITDKMKEDIAEFISHSYQVQVMSKEIGDETFPIFLYKKNQEDKPIATPIYDPDILNPTQKLQLDQQLNNHAKYLGTLLTGLVLSVKSTYSEFHRLSRRDVMKAVYVTGLVTTVIASSIYVSHRTLSYSFGDNYMSRLFDKLFPPQSPSDIARNIDKMVIEDDKRSFIVEKEDFDATMQVLQKDYNYQPVNFNP